MITVFTIKNCPYCEKLKKSLNENNIEFTEISDTNPKNEKHFVQLVALTKSEMMPTIIVGNDIFVPNVSFKTIDEGIGLIKSRLTD